MRYRGNKICPDERTNKQMDERGGCTAQKHNGCTDTVGWRKKRVQHTHGSVVNVTDSPSLSPVVPRLITCSTPDCYISH